MDFISRQQNRIMKNPITEKQKEVLHAFEKEGESSPHHIASVLGFKESAVIFGSIKSLVKKGKLKQTVKGRHSKYKTL